MTFLEKLKEDHPTLFDPDKHIDIKGQFCPYNFSYVSRNAINCHGMSCVECWDRQIPDMSEECETKPIDIEKLLNSTCVTVEFPDEPQKKEYESPIMSFKPYDEMTHPQILDSGNRREFETGAVRDIQEGKGRCDLLPLDVVGMYLNEDMVLEPIYLFTTSGEHHHLHHVLEAFRTFIDVTKCDIILELSKHFEEGAKKYGENNWQKGIPVRCYIDSAVRHYLKFLRGDKDEPHDRAFCWNIMCAIWTCKHKPELNDYARREKEEA